MPAYTDVVEIALHPVTAPRAGADRHGEPVTVGIPLRQGLARSPDVLALRGDDVDMPLQVRVLDKWPDGSLRWVLLDFQVDTGRGPLGAPVLCVGRPTLAVPSNRLQATVGDEQGGVRVQTGGATFEFRPGGAFPVSAVSASGRRALDAARSALVIETDAGSQECIISRVELRDSGPLRAELMVWARPRVAVEGSRLEVWARVELFAGLTTVRSAVTVRNPRRARHAGGQWGLGDPGSVVIRSARLRMGSADPAGQVRYATDPGLPLMEATVPFEIHQESSGGEHWNAPVHRDASGEVRLGFRGYRIRYPGRHLSGLRATPVVVQDGATWPITVTVLDFWQSFPSAIRVEEAAVEMSLWPASTAGSQELQGGEQRTHRSVVCFGSDSVTDAPLAWCHDPLRFYPSPPDVCGTGAVPWLVPVPADTDADYQRLVSLAFDSTRGFAAKRERADEYGWRNFGDVPADHESAFKPPEQPLVSHYNNQYDLVAGFCVHFLRTGDPRWWTLADELARHVRDIDVYHTSEDKSAYRGGLFWHTNHYTDAGTSTHRTYPPGGPASGGPSAEHNYNAGLMYHYWLTGDRASRDAAIGLGQWVVDMDDGDTTVFRWLASGPTGLASATAGHQGPGRGAGHSIYACLVAYRLSDDRRYLEKAEELIRRCMHPSSVIPADYVEDIESRWSYTAFLQALGIYLQHKTERQELDEMYTYARECLLRFARWMLDHERPYLERPERLEFPTQTWAAQELRKADVLWWAALLVDGDQRRRLDARAQFFFDYAVRTLHEMPGPWYARPMALVLSHGVRRAWFRSAVAEGAAWPSGPPLDRWARPTLFVPQRVRAVARARWLAGASIGAAALFWWLT